MSGHAKFAPSSLSRIVECAGYLTLRDSGVALPEDQRPEAEEGTAAHWAATELAQGRVVREGDTAPNGVSISEEMIECAYTFCDAVEPYRYDGADVRFEQKVDCSGLHKDCWGTPDFSAFWPAGGVLVISDYKFGHKYVPAVGNWQLIAYAFGVLQSAPPDMLPIEIVLQIVQPRSYHKDGPVREWTTNYAELSKYWAVLVQACIDAELPGAQCRVSSQCYMCPVRHVCDAANSAELSAMDLAGETVPLDLEPRGKARRLGQVRRALELLGYVESGIVEDLSNMIRTGGDVPGYGLESTAGRETWLRSVDEVVAMGGLFGVDLSKQGVITPAQARKAGVPDDVTKAYSERKSGAVKLVAMELKSIFKRK